MRVDFLWCQGQKALVRAGLERILITVNRVLCEGGWTMKRLLVSLFAVVLALGVVMPVAAAKQTKVDLCHYDTTLGSYDLLSVPERGCWQPFVET